MPSTVQQLLSDVNLKLDGNVRWGERIKENAPGVYLISMSPNPNDNGGTLEKAPIAGKMIEAWMYKVPSIELDGQKYPKPKYIIKRLAEFWLPDENILYIGQTTKSLSERSKDFFKTELGDRGPHSGGIWLKTLSNINRLFVYYSRCDHSFEKECALFDSFISRVSETTKLLLKDPENPFPFANLEYPRKRKRHGIRNSKRK